MKTITMTMRMTRTVARTIKGRGHDNAQQNTGSQGDVHEKIKRKCYMETGRLTGRLGTRIDQWRSPCNDGPIACSKVVETVAKQNLPIKQR